MITLFTLAVLLSSHAQAGVLERMYEIYNSSTTPPAWKAHVRNEMLQYSRVTEAPEPPQTQGEAFAAASLTVGGRSGFGTVKAAAFAVPEARAAVRLADGSGVSLSSGALRSDAMITVETIPESPASVRALERAELDISAVSEAVEFGPPGTSFQTPVQIALAYNPDLIRAKGLRARDLRVYYWNESEQEWQALPSTVDETARLVRAQTTHFSVYQAMGSGGVGAAATGAYGLVDVYAFPNPSRGLVTIRVQTGNADTVSVRVYDVAGRKVHEASSSTSAVVDDGNGKGAQPTYDITWDTSGIGSGVYTYVVTASRAGEADIKVRKKVAVIH